MVIFLRVAGDKLIVGGKLSLQMKCATKREIYNNVPLITLYRHSLSYMKI